MRVIEVTHRPISRSYKASANILNIVFSGQKGNKGHFFFLFNYLRMVKYVIGLE